MKHETQDGGRNEAFEQLMQLAAKYFVGSQSDKNSIKERICTTFIDPITVYQDRLNKIEEIAKIPRE